MSIRNQIFHLLLLVPIAGFCLAASAGAESAASIQVTAHVEAPLGMAEMIDSSATGPSTPAPGSHLYWLYFPREEGVVLQLSRSPRNAHSVASSADLVRIYPKMLRVYPQAALVSLNGADRSIDGDSTSVTLTVIFTNN